jgi:hypothetical protein
MSTSSTPAENATGIERAIDHDRVVRALTEEMMLTTLAPDMITVIHDDSEYGIDLVSGACDCADSQYRPETYCKHALKAAIVEIFTEGITTPFVARVARYLDKHPCPFGNDHVCDGVTGDRLPCPECINGTTVDIYTIWKLTAKRTGVQR